MMATPTYILRMADVARNKMGIDPSELSITKLTCAGEPGASIPSTKKRMEDAWGAKVFDHSGATEIGAWSYECEEQPFGMHVNEAMFLVEIEDIETGEIIEESGNLFSFAISRALINMDVFIFSSMDQPTTFLENKSSITHKYSHPFFVLM